MFLRTSRRTPCPHVRGYFLFFLFFGVFGNSFHGKLEFFGFSLLFDVLFVWVQRWSVRQRQIIQNSDSDRTKNSASLNRCSRTHVRINVQYPSTLPPLRLTSPDSLERWLDMDEAIKRNVFKNTSATCGQGLLLRACWEKISFCCVFSFICQQLLLHDVIFRGINSHQLLFAALLNRLSITGKIIARLNDVRTINGVSDAATSRPNSYSSHTQFVHPRLERERETYSAFSTGRHRLSRKVQHTTRSVTLTSATSNHFTHLRTSH